MMDLLSSGFGLMRLRIKGAARWMRRMLGLSPMQAVFRALARLGVEVRNADVLECFGFDGSMHTIDYARRVRSLTVWELKPHLEKRLRKTLPRATILITDSYVQVRHEKGRFDIIVVDNTPIQAEHYEGFDLFPHLFRLAKDECAIILDAIPKLNAAVFRIYPQLVSEGVREARRRFFRTSDAEQVSLETMAKAYQVMATEAGFELIRWFGRRRNKMMWYLVLQVKRSTAHRNLS